MTGPVSWFNLYWLLFGGLLVILAALFYYRVVASSFKERLQLVAERFDKKTQIFIRVLLLLNAEELTDYTIKMEGKPNIFLNITLSSLNSVCYRLSQDV